MKFVPTLLKRSVMLGYRILVINGIIFRYIRVLSDQLNYLYYALLESRKVKKSVSKLLSHC